MGARPACLHIFLMLVRDLNYGLWPVTLPWSLLSCSEVWRKALNVCNFLFSAVVGILRLINPYYSNIRIFYKSKFFEKVCSFYANILLFYVTKYLLPFLYSISLKLSLYWQLGMEGYCCIFCVLLFNYCCLILTVVNLDGSNIHFVNNTYFPIIQYSLFLCRLWFVFNYLYCTCTQNLPYKLIPLLK